MSKTPVQCSMHFGSIEAIILRATGVLWSTRCPVDWFIHQPLLGEGGRKHTKITTHVGFGMCFFDKHCFNKGAHHFFWGVSRKLHVFWSDWSLRNGAGLPSVFGVFGCWTSQKTGGVGGCFGHTSNARLLKHKQRHVTHFLAAFWLIFAMAYGILPSELYTVQNKGRHMFTLYLFWFLLHESFLHSRSFSLLRLTCSTSKMASISILPPTRLPSKYLTAPGKAPLKTSTFSTPKRRRSWRRCRMRRAKFPSWIRCWSWAMHSKVLAARGVPCTGRRDEVSWVFFSKVEVEQWLDWFSQA